MSPTTVPSIAERPRPPRPLRLGVLLSGGGRTLANLLARAERGTLDVRVVAVASDRSGVDGISIARTAAVPTRVFARDAFASRAARDAAMLQWVRAQGAQAVALAGYLSLLDPTAAEGLPVLNIHPALLPRFGGKGLYGERVHAAVLAAGETISGATVHVVDDRYDHGAILAQVRVPVLPGDDAHTLAGRVFAAECELYPAVLEWLACGQVSIRDGTPWAGDRPWLPVVLEWPG